MGNWHSTWHLGCGVRTLFDRWRAAGRLGCPHVKLIARLQVSAPTAAASRTAMRIACLQFAPSLGKTSQNIQRAEALLQNAAPQDLDLLILPELAFTGELNHPLRIARLTFPLAHAKATTSAPSPKYPHILRPQPPDSLLLGQVPLPAVSIAMS